MLEIRALRVLLSNVAIWIVACILYVFFRYYGNVPVPPDNLLVSLKSILGLGVGAGILFGLSYTVVDILYSYKWAHKHSFGLIIILSILLHGFVTVLVMSILRLRINDIFSVGIDTGVIKQTISAGGFIVILGYTAIITTLVTLLRGIDQRMGPGNLWKLLIGKFHKPRVEERIIMFLDMKSSTNIAESLGHIKFSELIQECFDDLSIAKNYKAEIYQYVGDEAILTWEVKNGLSKANCISSYFAYRKTLQQKAEYFRKKYGVVPFFKAGLHIGKVTIAEVGQLKREIAFHGDTMNTAARIQGMCNELDEGILISQELHDQLEWGDSYHSQKVVEMTLRGKSEQLFLYNCYKCKPPQKS